MKLWVCKKQKRKQIKKTLTLLFQRNNMIHSVLENVSVSLPEKDYMDKSTVTPTPALSDPTL